MDSSGQIVIGLGADELVLWWREAPSVELQPEDEMTQWSFIETRYGEISLLGTLTGTGKSRMTSVIASIDARTRTVTTSNGRRYRLTGPPGRSMTSDAVLLSLMVVLGPSVKIVTDALCQANRLRA